MSRWAKPKPHVPASGSAAPHAPRVNPSPGRAAIELSGADGVLGGTRSMRRKASSSASRYRQNPGPAGRGAGPAGCFPPRAAILLVGDAAGLSGLGSPAAGGARWGLAWWTGSWRYWHERGIRMLWLT